MHIVTTRTRAWGPQGRREEKVIQMAAINDSHLSEGRKKASSEGEYGMAEH